LDVSHGEEWAILPLSLLCFLISGLAENYSRVPASFRKLLNSRVIDVASALSYGVCLFHGFFISSFVFILKNNGNSIPNSPQYRLFLILSFAAFFSYLLKYLIFRLIELPGIDFGKKFHRIIWSIHTMPALDLVRSVQQNIC